MKIQFRILEVKDFPKMLTWLNTVHVKQFWKEPFHTVEDIEAKYGGYVTGEKPSSPYVIMISDVDIGYIQTYYYSDWQDDNDPSNYISLMDADKDSAGVDLFIGHKDYIHKGYGVHILKSFIKDFVFTNPRSVNVIITPEPDNIVAIKVYEKVGFKWYKTISTQNGEFEYLMKLSKEDFFNSFTH
ncbi:MAG: acetyltransferase [Oscillospiraceae bacterium]|nr:acetyltransferase [Oscillospiraceae bacterium]